MKNVLRATSTPGTITVRVSSPGLESGEITIESTVIEEKPYLGVVEPPLSDIGR